MKENHQLTLPLPRPAPISPHPSALPSPRRPPLPLTPRRSPRPVGPPFPLTPRRSPRPPLQCERQIERETVVAKTLVAQGETSRARLAVRKRKLQRKQLEQLEQYLLTVESVILDVEGAQRAARVADALKAGTAALREAHKAISLEEVEQLMAETAEAHEYQDRLADALAGQLSGEQEAEAEKELEKLQAELVAQKIIDLPDVPTTVPERISKTQTATQAEAQPETEQPPLAEEQPMLA